MNPRVNCVRPPLARGEFFLFFRREDDALFFRGEEDGEDSAPEEGRGSSLVEAEYPASDSDRARADGYRQADHGSHADEKRGKERGIRVLCEGIEAVYKEPFFAAPSMFRMAPRW